MLGAIEAERFAIKFAEDGAAFSEQPSVLRVGSRFHMWFCYRHGLDFRNPARGYRIGHAWSDDLRSWIRDDEAGELSPSVQGWDSEMVCYPCVFELDGRTLMLYSGNYFGRDGFGYAVLD